MDYTLKMPGYDMLIETAQCRTKQHIADIYSTCRKDKKITQEELAIRAGISRSNISRFESGEYNPSVDMLIKIASAMDMNVNICLEDKSEEKTV